MDTRLNYKVDPMDRVEFHNNACFCIGTGRMNLALRHEYHEQLKKVQEEIGFSHIRGHGLLCDDMAIYHTYEEDGEEKAEYNFTYLDMVFDDYRSMGLKPFVELGFMPEKLASGDQTVFYWKGNVTPPKDYHKWADLVTAVIEHWIDRYGKEEVVTWPFEVWNEPNLGGFWKGADMPEYFKLYEVTSKAVKKCDSGIRVGGPAICGVDDERWLRSFLEYCSANRVPLDFVTRHAYATEAPQNEGHYQYQKLRTPEAFIAELNTSRSIIDSFTEYAGMEMHITEFNTSYTPLNPIHDTNLNAAYVARLLSEMGDTCASYSYWTFGDVFEEAGVSFTPFSGCFGLLANGRIPKPTYWAFSFFQKLGENAIFRNENAVITKDGKGILRGVCWNIAEEEGPSYLTLDFSLELEKGKYVMIQKMVDEDTCNPLKTWVNMGMPANPAPEELKLIKETALPQVRTKTFEVMDKEGKVEIKLSANGLCYFEIKPVQAKADRGYKPEWIRGVES